MTQYTWPERPTLTAFPIAKPGYPFIVVSALVTFALTLSGLKILSLTGLGITLFICYFFRDPDRVIQEGENLISSPADGKVIVAGKEVQNPYGDGTCKKISIFMSVFNVHVNRIPFSGKVKEVNYFPGKFVNASFDKASEGNERNAVIIETETGISFATVQIAGLVARRIICALSPGDSVKRGKRYGMICFGSRLDLYLPLDTEISVKVDDKVKAGTTLLGQFK